MRTQQVVLAVAAAVPLALAGTQASQAAAAGGWTQTSPVAPAGVRGTYLGDVSCPRVTDCEAVGEGDATTPIGVAEQWNGTAWTLQSTPAPPDSTYFGFNDVSCASPSACTAVGQYNSGDLSYTLAERWNGTDWAVQSTPSPSGAIEASLDIVSCPTAVRCLAIGGYQDSTTSSGEIAELWNGRTWSLLSAPLPDWSITSLSCLSGASCIIVGYEGTGPTLMAASWNGTAWTDLPSPPVPTSAAGGDLASLWCGSATDCVAVGDSITKARNGIPMAESWNGTEWTIMRTPHIADNKSSGLNDVSCDRDGECTAVGGGSLTTSPKNYQAYVEHWNGKYWALQSIATPPGAVDDSLYSVGCPSNFDCTAIGVYVVSGKDRIRQLAEQYG
jgi:hypothetical protein